MSTFSPKSKIRKLIDYFEEFGPLVNRGIDVAQMFDVISDVICKLYDGLRFFINQTRTIITPFTIIELTSIAMSRVSFVFGSSRNIPVTVFSAIHYMPLPLIIKKGRIGYRILSDTT